MTPLIALLLGIVEGVTEYLPVSSTGHLVVAAHLLHTKPGAFEIVIQFGAILAVLIHYRRLLSERTLGFFRRDPKAIRLFTALLIGFVPTAIAGLVLRKTIKAHLFGPIPVAIGFLVGAVVMIVVERWLRARSKAREGTLEEITPLRALAIGAGQCFALWPGASRSMCTIVAGQLTGLSTRTAAEFSFLLGLPTLGAATLYEAYKSRAELTDVGWLNVGIGLVTSFLVAWAVIAAFLRYLERRGLEPFAYYRIVAGIAVLFLFP